MKFINKQTNFQSKKSPYPIYINSYARDGKIEIGENGDYLSIEYLFCHLIPTEFGKDDNKEIVINRDTKRNTALVFNQVDTATTIKNEQDETVEIYAFILQGGLYDKTKIVNWGKPSLQKVMTMIKKDSLVNGTEGILLEDLQEIKVGETIYPITTDQSQQIRQLMLDWLKEHIIIENEKLGINFELETL